VKNLIAMIACSFSLIGLAQDRVIKGYDVPGSRIESGVFTVGEGRTEGFAIGKSGDVIGMLSIEGVEGPGVGVRTVMELDRGEYFQMDVTVYETADGTVEGSQYLVACLDGGCVEMSRTMYGDKLELSDYQIDGRPAAPDAFKTMAFGLVADNPDVAFAVVSSATLAPDTVALSWPSFGNSYLSCLKQAVEDCGGSHNNGNCETFRHWGGSTACGAIHAAACGVLNPISVIGCAAALLF